MIDERYEILPPSGADLLKLALSDALLAAATLTVGVVSFIAICAFVLVVA